MLIAIGGFLASFTLMLLRIPIGLALITIGFLGFGLLNAFPAALSMVTLVTRDTILNYSLSVIPLFILMGNFIARSGISGDLYRAAEIWVGRKRGSLAMATVLSSGGFAAVCGSSIATIVTMARVALPSMKRYGYADSLSTASLVAGGTLGAMIPPSVIIIIYGIATETHIGKLYAAALIPGVIAIIGYLMAIAWTVHRDPSKAPLGESYSRRERLAALRNVWPILLLFIIVIGGIYAGIFTATEAAGVGAAGGFIFALVRRQLSMPILEQILVDTVRTTAVLFLIIVGANVFGEFLNFSGAHENILRVIQDSELAPWMVIAFMIVVYLIMGALMDELAMLLLTLPLFFPIVVSLGYDPLWFGILVTTLCAFGMIAPPIGINLFIMRSAAPEISMATILSGIAPFIFADVARVIAVAVFPVLSLWLPALFFD